MISSQIYKDKTDGASSSMVIGTDVQIAHGARKPEVAIKTRKGQQGQSNKNDNLLFLKQAFRAQGGDFVLSTKKGNKAVGEQ
jgi:hypothetical protein